MKIKNKNLGYFLISRKLFTSWIWDKPPYYIKLWIWLIGKCNHTTITKHGQTFKRGECLVTLEETRNQTKYKIGYREKKITKKQAWQFFEDLREIPTKDITNTPMIATTKTTVGMFVKVYKYDVYQSFKNYEGNSESNNKVTIREQAGNTINNNEEIMKKNECEARTKFLDFIYLSDNEYKNLDKILKAERDVYIQKINNYIGSVGTDKYKNHYYTILKWFYEDHPEEQLPNESASQWIDRMLLCNPS